MDLVQASGLFNVVHHGPDGRRVWGRVLKNAPTLEGINGILNSYFKASTRFATWYCRLISATSYISTSVNDTHAAHPGWTEYTGIAGGNGVAWVPGSPNGGLMTSLTSTTIQITSTGYIQGVFLASRALVGVASGQVIYATAPSTSPLQVLANGTITIQYSVRLRAQ